MDDTGIRWSFPKGRSYHCSLGQQSPQPTEISATLELREDPSRVPSNPSVQEAKPGASLLQLRQRQKNYFPLA